MQAASRQLSAAGRKPRAASRRILPSFARARRAPRRRGCGGQARPSEVRRGTVCVASATRGKPTGLWYSAGNAARVHHQPNRRRAPQVAAAFRPRGPGPKHPRPSRRVRRRPPDAGARPRHGAGARGGRGRVLADRGVGRRRHDQRGGVAVARHPGGARHRSIRFRKRAGPRTGHSGRGRPRRRDRARAAGARRGCRRDRRTPVPERGRHRFRRHDGVRVQSPRRPARARSLHGRGPALGLRLRGGLLRHRGRRPAHRGGRAPRRHRQPRPVPA